MFTGKPLPSMPPLIADAGWAEGTVRWKLPIGQLPAGNHEVRLTTILAKSFTESSGTYPAGQLEDIVCQLDVRP